jgi:histidyl-tRNA synthetase
MQKLQAIRGTRDYFGDDAKKFDYIVETARNVGANFGFESFFTPIFEDTNVFKRTLGETSDVVSKEMYSFETKGGESVTLRPEFTAGIARAFIDNGLQQNLPLKLFSTGPLFRYERPQKGRQRQFHQINFECLGIADSTLDVEMILLGAEILKALKLKGNIVLNINSLGDKQSRENYTAALVEFLKGSFEKLSEDSKIRLEKNPLRILDSKDSGDKEILKNAPKIADFYTVEAKDFFENVVSNLKQNLDFEVVINDKIVRGLDYYNHTVFEFIAESEELGAQNTILAGGRYDNLIAQMGGQPTPAFGFAAGVERLMLMLDELPENKKQKIAIIADDNSKALQTAKTLRGNNIVTEIILGGNFKKKIQKADKISANFVLFIFDTGLELKNLATGEQVNITLEEIINKLSAKS